MHDAYESVPIWEKLPLQIESIDCFGKTERSSCKLNVRFAQKQKGSVRPYSYEGYVSLFANCRVS